LEDDFENPEEIQDVTEEPQDLGVPKRRGQKKALVVAEPEPVRPFKMSEHELQERRTKVYRLRLQGISYSNIAKMLNMSVLTVRRDLEHIRKDNQTKIDQFQQNQFVGESLLVFDEIINRAWNEYNSNKEGNPRLKSLDLIRTTQNDKLRVLQETGMIHKQATAVEHTHVVSLPWTENVKDAVIQTLLQQKLSPQLAAPTPDPNYIEIKHDNDTEKKPT